MTTDKMTIIISGMPGTGKTTLAHALAKKYKLEIFTGSDVFKEMAREQGYNPDINGWWETKDGMEFLKKRYDNPQFDRKVDDVGMKVAKKGGVVITSWTLPYLGAPGIKIFIVASQEERARRIAGRDGISFGEAFEIVKERDEKNRRLYKKLYGFNLGKDLKVFDIIIGSDEISAEETAQQSISLIDKMIK